MSALVELCSTHPAGQQCCVLRHEAELHSIGDLAQLQRLDVCQRVTAKRIRRLR